MNIYQFMSTSPWLSFFIALMILVTIEGVICRIIRHLDISKHGWPPKHLNADGSFKKEWDEL